MRASPCIKLGRRRAPTLLCATASRRCPILDLHQRSSAGARLSRSHATRECSRQTSAATWPICQRSPSKAPRGDLPATTITSLHRGARGPFSTRVKDMTDQKDAETPRGAHGTGISRRSLLAGTAGLTFAGALAGSTVQAIADHDHAHQSAAGDTTGSGRLYQVNPGVTDRA